ncbi:DUF2177 family protein [Pseudooceanicola algae]|uniref:DUF2177 domain-containing protein n=1 Tax=Pseudooceanicola algae TaxID=1537215 RepID=A0A418SGY6_9RHOB|nr:DUF2177 family protein [Pseudooceanicola algae]QPM88901.1 hypothetical protein PSAL_001040 [Pseudooceanicola algae]
MQILTLYLSTAILFLGLDAVMLKLVMRPLFEARLGNQLLEDPRLGPAGIFYLFYVAGLLWFVSLPALAEGGMARAFWGGALLGAMAYGTYEFTNFATLRAWDWRMVMVDLTWGTLLTGLSAALGVGLVGRLFP